MNIVSVVQFLEIYSLSYNPPPPLLCRHHRELCNLIPVYKFKSIAGAVIK